MSQKKINSILEEIASNGSKWNVIMDNILDPNYEKKPELLSEITIQLYDKIEETEKAYQQGWFRFYFTAICCNQVKSSTSSFHRNCRETLNTRHNKYFNKIVVEMEHGWTAKEHKELQINQKLRLKLIKQASKRADLKSKWIESEMARLHLKEGLSFRKIESYYEGTIKYTRAHQLFSRWKKKFNIELQKLVKSNS